MSTRLRPSSKGTSTLALTVEPNPVAAGAEATLSLTADGLPSDALAGAGAEWQCWNGSEWIATPQIVRGFHDGDAVTLEVEPGATTTIPAVGLAVPNSYPILLPDVPPGAYRVVDLVFGAAGEEISGLALVEVR